MNYSDEYNQVSMLNKMMSEIENVGRNGQSDPSHKDLMNMVSDNHRMFK